MKKRLLLAMFALVAVTTASAQVNDIPKNAVIDSDEDTTQVTTIDDIITMQQRVSVSSETERHLDNVWGRRKYVNIGYNSTTLESDKAVAIGTGDNQKLNFEKDWGFGIELGTNYRLHKPISNIVSINLDYTWFDLNLSHFKEEKNAYYNSADRIGTGDDALYYMPWKALEKYEVNYGMMLGPSVTVAPFITQSSQALHYFKFQLYYHLGYRFSTIFMKNDKKKDLVYQQSSSTSTSTSTTSASNEDNDMNNNFKGEWGTGFYTKFGFNVSWKFIGIGYEHSSGSINYKPYSKDTFGKEKNKFKLGTNRIYLTIRY